MMERFLLGLYHAESECKGIDVERQLWHGADAEAVKKVIKYGFNRNFCRASGTPSTVVFV